MKKLLLSIAILSFVFILSSCNKDTPNEATALSETHDYYSTTVNDITSVSESTAFSNSADNSQSESEESTTVIGYIDGMYSRADVAQKCKRIGFGTWFQDPEYVAAKYLYESDELADIYGDDFQIIDVWGPSEMSPVYFPNIYSGVSNLSLVINNDIWRVDLKKEKFEKWKVVDCYLSSESYEDYYK